MALITIDRFPVDKQWDYLVPFGEVPRTPQPPHYAAPVLLPLSNGRVVTVFDSLRTALLLMEQMRVNKQSFVYAGEDCMVISVNYHKLLVCEPTLIIQKLLSAYTPVYSSGQVLFVHRSLSSVESLGAALSSEGAAVPGALLTNADLRQAKIPIVAVDWNFPDTQLEDTQATAVYYVWSTRLGQVDRGRPP